MQQLRLLHLATATIRSNVMLRDTERKIVNTAGNLLACIVLAFLIATHITQAHARGGYHGHHAGAFHRHR